MLRSGNAIVMQGGLIMVMGSGRDARGDAEFSALVSG
jgi:hypothetical protein